MKQPNTQLLADLEAAKAEQSRCMGGVDPAGCIAASKRIMELRLTLRDDVTFMEHLQKVRESRPVSSRGSDSASDAA